MLSWLRRLLGSDGENLDEPPTPTGIEHDYRPAECDRGHDWAVLDNGSVDGVHAAMQIEAWGSTFRRGDKIVIGSPAQSWWIIKVKKEGNAWFPDRVILDLSDTFEH